jgi:hypothetical protein
MSVDNQEVTLKQFSRALAIHALIINNPPEARGFFAPELAETLAEVVYRFAIGEHLSRPNPPEKAVNT